MKAWISLVILLVGGTASAQYGAEQNPAAREAAEVLLAEYRLRGRCVQIDSRNTAGNVVRDEEAYADYRRLIYDAAAGYISHKEVISVFCPPRPDLVRP